MTSHQQEITTPCLLNNATTDQQHDSTSSDPPPSHHPECALCKAAAAKYTCPQCNAPYCSVRCFKSIDHARCSERFYRQCIVDELQTTTNNNSKPEERQRIIEMLRRNPIGTDPTFIQSGSDEDESTTPIDDEIDRRFADVTIDANIDEEELWQRMSEEERKQFLKFAQSDAALRFVDDWQPWWQQLEPAVLTDPPPPDPNRPQLERQCPSLCPPTTIPDLSDVFSRRPPSDSVVNAVVDIGLAYVGTCRLFNGLHQEMAEEAVESLMSMSEALATGRNFLSCAEVVYAGTPRNFKGDLKREQLLDDVCLLLAGPSRLRHSDYFVRAALSDSLALIRSALTRRKSSSPTDRSALRRAAKKLEYLIAWSGKYGGVSIEKALRELQVIQVESKLENVQQATAAVGRRTTKKAVSFIDTGGDSSTPLITEIVGENGVGGTGDAH